LEIFDELGASDFKGEALYEFGVMYHRIGEIEKAIELIEKSLEIFEGQGMVLWSDRCREKLDEYS